MQQNNNVSTDNLDIFIFNEKNHVYTLNGKRLYGVTSVLGVIAKPALIQWSANIATIKALSSPQDENLKNAVLKKLDEKGKISTESMKALDEQFPQFKEIRLAHRAKTEESAVAGTDIHKIIEDIVKNAIYTNNGFVKEKTHELKQIQNFLDWAHEEPTQFLYSEKKLYSKNMWVAGTCDLCFTRKGKKYVGDIKTTEAIWDRTPFFQIAAYEIMFEEQGETFDGRCVIRLGKDGKSEIVYSFSDLDKQGFLHALGLFKALEQPVTYKQKIIKDLKNKKKHK